MNKKGKKTGFGLVVDFYYNSKTSNNIATMTSHSKI